MRTGYIKLWRELLSKEIYRDPKTRILLIHVLLSAEWERTEHKGHVLEPGSFLTTLKELSEETGLTMRETRTALKRLTEAQTIDTQTTNKYTVITVENWTKYQGRKTDSDKQTTSKRHAKRQTNDIPTSYKEEQEEKEGECDTDAAEKAARVAQEAKRNVDDALARLYGKSRRN